MVAHAHNGWPTIVITARFAAGFITPVIAAWFAPIFPAVISPVFTTGFLAARFFAPPLFATWFFATRCGGLDSHLDRNNLCRFVHTRPTVTPATAAARPFTLALG
jgi:hypothetical protein